METSLHRQLKEIYAVAGAATEVRLGAYRIDVIREDHLIEIQHGHLSAIRHKVAALLREHRVTIVKPIVASKRLVYLRRRGGKIVRKRASPKRGSRLDVFRDLLHFTKVFPHPLLEIEVLLVDIEELRCPGHGRRRRWRRNDHQIEDQRLVGIRDRFELRTASDLRELIPVELPPEFHTGDLAAGLGVERWFAQQVAYCLREMGAIRLVGKRQRALLYRWNDSAPDGAARAA